MSTNNQLKAAIKAEKNYQKKQAELYAALLAGKVEQAAKIAIEIATLKNLLA